VDLLMLAHQQIDAIGFRHRLRALGHRRFPSFPDRPSGTADPLRTPRTSR
jgi:hypothetical protein